MKSRSMMSLLGGALAGATAMYLLDPDMGEKRRRVIAKQAGEYVDDTQDALASGWSKASDYVGDLGHAVADKAQTYGSQLSGAAQDYGSHLADRADDVRADWADRAEGWLNRGKHMLRRYGRNAQDYVPSTDDVTDRLNAYRKGLMGQVQGLKSNVGNRASKATHQARQAIGENQSPILPVAITAVGCCAIGVGVMYIIDPRMGRARRAWLMDKSRSMIRKTGNTFYRTGKHWSNRAYGMAAETRGAGEQLVERVKSAIHGVVNDPRVVQVMGDANGTITVAGKLLAEECDRVLQLVRSIPGVNSLIDRLERMQADNSSGSTGSSQSGQSTSTRNEGISHV